MSRNYTVAYVVRCLQPAEHGRLETAIIGSRNRKRNLQISRSPISIAKRRAPAYSRVMRQIRGVVQIVVLAEANMAGRPTLI